MDRPQPSSAPAPAASSLSSISSQPQPPPQLQLQIPTIPNKFLQNFPNDPKSDIIIEHKHNQYHLYKAYLRMQSDYFRNVLTNDRTILKIEQNYDEEIFRNVMECLYGGVLKVLRGQIEKYYEIVVFLGVEILLGMLRKDILEHTSQYDIFRLFTLSYKHSDQQIFQKCLLQLQFHNYSQLHTNHPTLNQLPPQLFKLIIKSHNRQHKKKQAYTPYQINKIITEYCKYKKLDQKEKNRFKVELIDKNGLNSNQFRDIFIDDRVEGREEGKEGREGRRLQTRAFSLGDVRKDIIMGNDIFHSLSLNTLTRKKIQLQMQTTFQRKISQQLLAQQQQYHIQIHQLSKTTKLQQKHSLNINKQLQQLRKKISQKQKQHHQQFSQKISNLDSSLSQLQKNILTESKRLKELMDGVKEMLDRSDLNKDKNKDKDKSIDKNRNMDKMQNSVFQDLSYICNQGMPNQQQQRYNKNNSNHNKSVFSNNSKSQTEIKHQGSNKGIATVLSQSDHINVSNAHVNVSHAHVNVNVTQNKGQYYGDDGLVFEGKSSILRNGRDIEVLSSILGIDRFHKKNLILLYHSQPKYQNSQSSPQKRLQNPPKITNTPQTCSQLRKSITSKQNILLLFKTAHDKIIGTFHSTPINVNKPGDYQDQNAFIFSITQACKLTIKKTQVKQAVMINSGYIICFNMDLMISQELFENQNYCGWPGAYEIEGKGKGRGKEGKLEEGWFVEDSQFAIKEVQAYQVQDFGSQMIL